LFVPGAGGKVHVTEIAKTANNGRIGGRGEQPARGHRLLHLCNGGSSVLCRRFRVFVADPVQVHAQALREVAVETQVQSSVVLAGRRRRGRRHSSSTPSPPDDGRVLQRRYPVSRRHAGRRVGERHLLRRV